MSPSVLIGRGVSGAALVALLGAWGGSSMASSRSSHGTIRDVPVQPTNEATLTIDIAEDPNTLSPLATQLDSSGSVFSRIMEGVLSSNSKGHKILGVTDDRQDQNSLYGLSGYQFSRAVTACGMPSIPALVDDAPLL